MKRKPMKTGAVALILALIYFFGLAVGIFVICYLPTGSKSVRLVGMVEKFAAKYVESKRLDNLPFFGEAAIAFSSDGQVLNFSRQSAKPIYHDFVEQGNKYLPKVLDGQNTLRLVLLAKDGTDLGYTSLMYIGVPMVVEGEIAGAVFWVKELNDLLETILGYISVFTLIFASAAIFMLLSLRNQRRYEQMRRNYTDNIAHELKSPIASIKALVEALSDGMEKSANDRNVYYGMILSEANRQERMIYDVLELSKLKNSTMDIKRQKVDTYDVFHPVLDKYALLYDLKGIAFSISEEIERLPELYTNSVCIQKVLEVILGNALKFVPEGGTIRISAQVSHKRVTICIADNGKGISEEALPHIFERFFKGNRNDNESGSGLGLAIAKEIMTGMNEDIWICSEDGKGTQAYFTIAHKDPSWHLRTVVRRKYINAT